MKRLFFALLVGIAAFAVVVLLRTATFTSKQVLVEAAPPLAFDPDAVAQTLAGALRFKTISYSDPALIDWDQFVQLRHYLEERFPLVHQRVTREIVGDYTLLYTWKGSEPSLDPIVLMSHQDVVPVEAGAEEKWTQPPFSGRIVGGYIWGRGALDDKFGVVGQLQAAELLLAQGFQPKRTIILLFGHDEEVGGDNGALRAAHVLRERNVRAELVLDEGGAVMIGAIPGLDRRVAFIGTAEKGSISLGLSVEVDGGHSSTPPQHTAIGMVGYAVHELEEKQMPMQLRGPARAMIDYVGPELPLPFRMILANLWLTLPAIEYFSASSPTLAATMRTTTAPTIIKGGMKENVLPSSAQAVVNFRILPGDSMSDVKEHARRAVTNEQVKIDSVGLEREASPESPVGTPSFLLLQRTISEVFRDVIVAPFLVLGGTDSRHLAEISDNIYRFTPIEEDPTALKRVHGIDERMSVTNYADAVRFFARIMQNAGD